MNKKGDFTLAHYIIYYLILAAFILYVCGSIKAYEGKDFIETHKDQVTIKHLLYFDILTDLCFTSRDIATGKRTKGEIDLKLFTDEILQKCIPLSARLTLEGIHTEDKHVITSKEGKEPLYQPEQLRKMLVLVEGKPFILTMELDNA